MDSTKITLILAMGAAVCAAFISAWLLNMMVPTTLFWGILLTSFVCAPTGLFMPWICSRRQRRNASVPTLNIFTATLLSVMAGGGLVALDHKMPDDTPTSFNTDEFIRTMIAISGISMAFSLVCFLLHYVVLQEITELRRKARRLLKWSRWAAKAKVLVCDDLEEAAPGECAVCLDALATLPAWAAHMPPPGAKAASVNRVGLLRLPCGHTFHGDCADRWMAREVICPMCRRPIVSLSRCTRLVLKAPPGVAHRHLHHHHHAKVGDEMDEDRIFMPAPGGGKTVAIGVEGPDAEVLRLPPSVVAAGGALSRHGALRESDRVECDGIATAASTDAVVVVAKCHDRGTGPRNAMEGDICL